MPDTTTTQSSSNSGSILKVIREKCLNCSCWVPSEVRKCKIIDCVLWPYRMGRKPTFTTYTAKDVDDERGTEDEILHVIPSRLKAIRAKCLDCCGDQSLEVEYCTCKENCSLYPYRFGKNPNITEETRQKRREAALKRGFGQISSNAQAASPSKSVSA